MTAHYTHNLVSANGKRMLISVDKLQNYQHGSDFAIISLLHLLISNTLVCWSFIILLSKIRNIHKHELKNHINAIQRICLPHAESESRMLHSYTGLDTHSIGRTSKVISIICILTQVLWKQVNVNTWLLTITTKKLKCNVTSKSEDF